MLLSRRDLFVGSLALPALAARKEAPVRPNILLIVIDQLPCFVLGAYGNKEIRTPNIDRLANAGTRFQAAIACTPEAGISRATLLTGRTPMQLGAGGIAPGDMTLEKILGGAGYATQTTGDFTEAGKFLDGQAAGKPFFLNVNYSGLKPPYDGFPPADVAQYATQEFPNFSVEAAAANASTDKDMLAIRLANWRKLAAGITGLDTSIGALATGVYRKQLIDNTLFIITASCGALYGRHGLWGAGDASDPVNMFREVVNVPLIWNWPGHVPVQATPVALVSTYDLVPTICDVVGAPVPARNLCGRSYLLLATGKRLPKKERWRTTVFGEYRNTAMARADRYKLVWRNEGKGPNELYDLVADAGERTNQIDNEHYITVRNSLAGELAGWKKQYSS
jgi:arylsulfatase A-like enzyme